MPWHFDRHYWQTCTSERMLTAFIPFHDCDEEMGTITMVDGSHRGRRSARRRLDAGTSPSATGPNWSASWARTPSYNGTEVSKIPMVIPKGHMSFHHCRIYHGSGANLSGRPRRAISFHLQDGDNQYRRYAKQDGSEVVYNHDVAGPATADGHARLRRPRLLPGAVAS